MNYFGLGDFVDVFAVALLLAAAWLAVCRVVPRLHRSPAASFGVAIGLTWVPGLLSGNSLTIFTVASILAAGAFVCLAMVYDLGPHGAAADRAAGHHGAVEH